MIAQTLSENLPSTVKLASNEMENLSGGSNPCVDFLLGFGGVVAGSITGQPWAVIVGAATMLNYAGDCDYYMGW